MKKNKTPAQLNRMKLRNQVEFFGDLFVGCFVERRLMVSSANEIFGTSEPVPEFDELAGHFRIWALTRYPAFADCIDSALRDARVRLSMERTSRVKPPHARPSLLQTLRR